jgi:hypothetical protein
MEACLPFIAEGCQSPWTQYSVLSAQHWSLHIRVWKADLSQPDISYPTNTNNRYASVIASEPKWEILSPRLKFSGRCDVQLNTFVKAVIFPLPVLYPTL